MSFSRPRGARHGLIAGWTGRTLQSNRRVRLSFVASVGGQLAMTCASPSRALLMLAEAGLAEPDLAPITRARFHQIAEQAEWLRDLIDHWLRADEPRETRAVTDLLRVVNEAAAAESVTYQGELTVVWPLEPVLTPVSPVLSRRIIGNLLNNAARAAGPVGKVVIEMPRDELWARVVVEDTGPGFGKIEGGLGLGLSAVAANVMSCGGKLESDRGKLGGARFSLWLPRTVA